LIPQKSIAVLPFENLSDDKVPLFRRRHSGRNPDQAREHRRFEVISRTSTAKYKSSRKI